MQEKDDHKNSRDTMYIPIPNAQNVLLDIPDNLFYYFIGYGNMGVQLLLSVATKFLFICQERICPWQSTF